MGSGYFDGKIFKGIFENFMDIWEILWKFSFVFKKRKYLTKVFSFKWLTGLKTREIYKQFFFIIYSMRFKSLVHFIIHSLIYLDFFSIIALCHGGLLLLKKMQKSEQKTLMLCNFALSLLHNADYICIFI